MSDRGRDTLRASWLSDGVRSPVALPLYTPLADGPKERPSKGRAFVLVCELCGNMGSAVTKVNSAVLFFFRGVLEKRIGSLGPPQRLACPGRTGKGGSLQGRHGMSLMNFAHDSPGTAWTHSLNSHGAVMTPSTDERFALETDALLIPLCFGRQHRHKGAPWRRAALQLPVHILPVYSVGGKNNAHKAWAA